MWIKNSRHNQTLRSRRLIRSQKRLQPVQQILCVAISTTEISAVWDIYFTESNRHVAGKLYHTTVNGKTSDVLLEDHIVAPLEKQYLANGQYEELIRMETNDFKNKMNSYGKEKLSSKYSPEIAACAIYYQNLFGIEL